jgi:hypothetical protein
MLDYDHVSRLQLAREQAERLADEMRRSRRLTPDVAGYPGPTRLGGLLRRLKHLDAGKPERTTPVYNA